MSPEKEDWPNDDDWERISCPDAGRLGHWSCGWCADSGKPVFQCGHDHTPQYN